MFIAACILAAWAGQSLGLFALPSSASANVIETAGDGGDAVQVGEPADTSSMHFNVDFGEGSLPSAEVSGEADQAGFWNGLGYTKEAGWQLRDIAGRKSGVQLSVEGAASWLQCLPTILVDSSPLAPLLRDGVHGMDTGLSVSFQGLTPGWYALFVYAKPHCQAQDTRVIVAGGQPEQACVLLDAQGWDPETSVHVVHVQESNLHFALEAAGSRAEVRLSGLQLMYLGSARERSVRFLSQAGVRFAIDARGRAVRDETASELNWVGWNSLGSLAPGGLASGSVGLFVLARNHQWELPFQSVSLGPRPRLLRDGRQSLRAPVAFANGIESVGASIWCQVYGRSQQAQWQASPADCVVSR